MTPLEQIAEMYQRQPEAKFWDMSRATFEAIFNSIGSVVHDLRHENNAELAGLPVYFVSIPFGKIILRDPQRGATVERTIEFPSPSEPTEEAR